MLFASTLMQAGRLDLAPRLTMSYAVFMTSSRCERPAPPEHKCFFLFCALLLANDRRLRLFSRAINLANHVKAESSRRSFPGAELPLGGVPCVRVLVFRNPRVSQAGRYQGPEPHRTSSGCVQLLGCHPALCWIEVRVVALILQPP